MHITHTPWCLISQRNSGVKRRMKKEHAVSNMIIHIFKDYVTLNLESTGVDRCQKNAVEIAQTTN